MKFTRNWRGLSSLTSWEQGPMLNWPNISKNAENRLRNFYFMDKKSDIYTNYAMVIKNNEIKV